jgi:hypothetical protein
MHLHAAAAALHLALCSAALQVVEQQPHCDTASSLLHQFIYDTPCWARREGRAHQESGVCHTGWVAMDSGLGGWVKGEGSRWARQGAVVWRSGSGTVQLLDLMISS